MILLSENNDNKVNERSYVDSIEFNKEGKTTIVKSIEERVQTVTVTKDRIIGAVVIAVVGTMSRVGVTHTCLTLAKYLTDLKLNVAIVEYNNSNAFKAIKESYEELKEIEDGFVLDGIVYYPYNEKLDIPSILDSEKYNYVILDLGSCRVADMQEFKRATKRIVVSGTKTWELQALRNYIETADALVKNIFYFTLADSEDYKLVEANMPGLKCYLGPIRLNPLAALEEDSEIFKDMLDDVLPRNLDVNNKGILKKLFSKGKTK